MAHINGVWLVDAPASALNNAGADAGARTDNEIAVKYIRHGPLTYPYVSAQAFRYWLRETLARNHPEWKAAPIWREKKIAYTDANPIRFWDDDLLGYMRAGSTKKEDAEKAAEKTKEGTATSTEITRVSPFRVGTLVSIGPVDITRDFGTMSRQDADVRELSRDDKGRLEGPNPVPHEHQFYRTTLKGLFDLDLHACGTFYHRFRTGFRNLDDNRIEEAKKAALEELTEEMAYRLPLDQRVQRVATLFEALAALEGGAKQTLHYTPVAPCFFLAAVMRGGVSPFQFAVGTNLQGEAALKPEALREALEVWQDQILSPIYCGWRRGFMDDGRPAAEAILKESKLEYVVDDPRRVFRQIAADLKQQETWMD